MTVTVGVGRALVAACVLRFGQYTVTTQANGRQYAATMRAARLPRTFRRAGGQNLTGSKWPNGSRCFGAHTRSRARRASVPTEQLENMNTKPLATTRAIVRLVGRIGRVILLAVVMFMLPVGCSLTNHLLGESTPWWELRRDSSGQAPDPLQHREAIIQVYAARAARWRGAFGVHTWIAVKPVDAKHYTRIEVFGFNLRWNGHTVSFNRRTPDSYWFGSKPWLLREIRGGAEVDAMIDRLVEAARNYPYDKQYRVWPGPNSNTFIAWLGRELPELELELPATAIGKDYLPGGALFASTPSGKGKQFSVAGVLGLLVGVEAGVEVNLLGFNAGVDLSPPAIKLPGVGRIGFRDFQSKEYR